MATPIDTAGQADQLADLFLKLSMALDQYRADNLARLTPDQLHQLSDNAQHLDDFAMHFTVVAIGATLAGIQGEINTITRATADANQAIKTAAKIERVATIAAAAVALGAAIAAGNPGTIASAASGLVTAIGGSGSTKH